MANSITLPAPGSEVKLVPSGEPRAVTIFNEDRNAPKVPQTNAAGQPLYAFDALAQFAGTDLGTVRVQTPLETLPATGFGSVLVGSGAAEMKIGNQRDKFELRITITLEGIEVPAPARRGGE